MNIRDSASQFTIHVFAHDIDRGAGIKVALAQVGYDAFFFEDRDTLLSRIENKPPHILIFSTASLKENLSDFVEGVLKIMPEIRFIVLAKPSQYETLASYNSYGLVDILEDSDEMLAVRALFSVDRACESLYWQYQNEQLIRDAGKMKTSLDEAKTSMAKQSNLVQEKVEEISRRGPPVSERIRDYLSAKSKEDLISRWMLALQGKPCAYLQYLPSVKSLVVTHGTLTESQGVGCQLSNAEAQEFAKEVTLGVVPPTLDELLKKAFQFKSVRLLPLFTQGKLEGVAAYPGELTGTAKADLEDEFAIFALAYAHFSMEKRLDTLEVMDSVTEVYNRKFGTQKVQDEWSRARRIHQPLSLVKMALDDFFELEQTLGENTRDQLLKNLAQLIQKTSRTNDFVFRSGLNELTMILPHCNRQGAMIRAERLRRVVESSQMLENGLKVSVSLGISEYPTLCSDAKSLDETAAKALIHILEKGGNRLCLSKAPANHKPEFEVPAEAVTGPRS
ncbi:MAG: GGDEF domain-containing protein [Bdellovibrionaceae bacterium]|nr:GGDEF domain-containing protein [Pseudobdellovibrionaceae bacterium]